MSKSYKDLDLTAYPDAMDVLANKTDANINQASLIKKYKEYLSNGKTSDAKKILNNNPDLAECLITADDFNKLQHAIMAVQRYDKDIGKNYATAEQGKTADKAMPKSGDQFTGDVSFSNGTKLDFLNGGGGKLRIVSSKEDTVAAIRAVDNNDKLLSNLLQVDTTTGKITGGALMTKADGEFTTSAYAVNTTRQINGHKGELMNISMRDASNLSNVSTRYLIFRRE